MANTKPKERDDDFGVWLAQNYGSMSAKGGKGKPEAPAKKTAAKKPTAKKTGKK